MTSTLHAVFIPVTDLREGHRIAGGVVTGVRTSQSGLTVYVSVNGHEFSQSARTRICVFHADGCADCGHTVDAEHDGTGPCSCGCPSFRDA